MVGDAVWVSAVDRLRGAEEKHWLPGVVIDVASVKVTVHLCDGRVVCRHRDQVRWREVAVAPPERSDGLTGAPGERSVSLRGESVAETPRPAFTPPEAPPAVEVSVPAEAVVEPAAASPTREAGVNPRPASALQAGHGYNLRPRQAVTVPHRYR